MTPTPSSEKERYERHQEHWIEQSKQCEGLDTGSLAYWYCCGAYDEYKYYEEERRRLIAEIRERLKTAYYRYPAGREDYVYSSDLEKILSEVENDTRG